MNGDQLREASGIQQYARRIRELRQEEGWDIQSIRDNPALKQNEYLLAKPPPDRPPVRFTRRVSHRLRVAVFLRNHSVCRLCGLTADDFYEDGRKVTLHVDHIIPKQEGGTDEMENLRTLCSQCNEGARDNLEPPPASLLRLKGLVRNADSHTQKEILTWLQDKFSPSSIPKGD